MSAGAEETSAWRGARGGSPRWRAELRAGVVGVLGAEEREASSRDGVRSAVRAYSASQPTRLPFRVQLVFLQTGRHRDRDWSRGPVAY